MKSSLKTSDFSFDLPSDLIAQEPLAQREASRLMAIHVDERAFEHTWFAHLPQVFSSLSKKPLLILNNSLVIPVRLKLKDERGRPVEIFVINPLKVHGPYEALAKPLRHRFVGEKLFLGERVTLEVTSLGERLEFVFSSGDSLSFVLETFGQVPLPPYIRRESNVSDRDRYQTVYGEYPGSLAAPTAGLHFSHDLLKDLEKVGAEKAYITLHVGLGTFQPIRTEEMNQHVMHREWFEIPQKVKEQIRRAREQGRPVIAVGTTSFRALESWDQEEAGDKETDLFLYPKGPQDRYESARVDGLITNFHQPESTLVMLMAYLMTYDFWKKVYEEAVRERYRFCSYGDAQFIWLRSSQLFS